MFIKSSLLIILAVIFILITISIVGCAKHHFSNLSPEKKAEWITKKISSELDLDEKQQTALDSIKTEILAKHKDLKEMKSDIHNEILKQVKSDKIDEDALNAIFTEKESEFKEFRAFMINKFTEFHSMLTPEQRIVLAKKIEEHKGECPH